MRMSAVWGKCVGDGCAELATTWREVVELGEAIAKFDVAEIVEEWHDVVAGIQCWAYVKLGKRWNWRIPTWAGRPSFEKYQKRVDWYIANVYTPEGWSFCVSDLSGGSNPAKPAKVEAVKAKARARLGV